MNISHLAKFKMRTTFFSGQEVMDNYCIHFSELPTVTRRPWIQV